MPAEFTIILTVILMMAALILAVIVFAVVKGIARWMHNNAQPERTVSARVVAKRTRVSGHDSVSTSYYVTVEMSSGQRVEFRVRGKQYGRLAEGDHGTLVHQGSRFKQFHRNP